MDDGRQVMAKYMSVPYDYSHGGMCSLFPIEKQQNKTLPDCLSDVGTLLLGMRKKSINTI